MDDRKFKTYKAGGQTFVKPAPRATPRDEELILAAIGYKNEHPEEEVVAEWDVKVPVPVNAELLDIFTKFREARRQRHRS